MEKSLIYLMLKKEIVHYKRMIALFSEMKEFGAKFIAFPIIFCIITFLHYCFASMHFLFEATMYVFQKTKFKQNMELMHKKTDKILNEMKSVTQLNLITS